MNLKDYIATIPDYPKEGILFRDITPLMADGPAFAYATQQIVDYAREVGAELVVGPEARGFIIGCPVAYAMEIGFAPVRKPKKLPREVIEVEYEKEYGTIKLVEKLGGEVVGCAFLIELEELEGAKLLKGYPYKSLMVY